MPVREKLLGVEGAAEMIGRSENAVRRMVERRQIPSRKSGRRLLFLESELQEFIEGLPGMTIEELRERENATI